MNQPTSGPGAFIGERCLATDSNSPGKVWRYGSVVE
jgi:hypothetical protein